MGLRNGCFWRVAVTMLFTVFDGCIITELASYQSASTLLRLSWRAVSVYCVLFSQVWRDVSSANKSLTYF